MKKMKILYLIIIIICIGASCESRILKSFDLIMAIDSIPPKLEYIESPSPYCVKIIFNETLNSRDKIKLNFDGVDVSNYSVKSNTVTYFLKDPLECGIKYLIKIKVEDLNRNSTYIESFVYTKNNNRANVLISEVSTKGTAKNCDKVELIVTKSGSLASIVVSDGFNDNFEDRCVLPDIYVNEGEYIVISFKEEEEDCFISENKKGLSSNNGCILILDTPSYNSNVIDCLVYSNKISENSEGFANEKTLSIAKTLVSIGMWENTFPLALGAVDSTNETSTRTINRLLKDNSYFQDTNTYEDFYITVTSGDSFGSKNNLNIYNQ